MLFFLMFCFSKTINLYNEYPQILAYVVDSIQAKKHKFMFCSFLLIPDHFLRSQGCLAPFSGFMRRTSFRQTILVLKRFKGKIAMQDVPLFKQLEIKPCGFHSRIRDMEAEWRLIFINDLIFVPKCAPRYDVFGL